MYINNKILIGKNAKREVNILLDKANRHGIITGASGSGKTITLKVLAESFSSAGVPVFMVDVKGDLAATSLLGESNDNVAKRVETLKLEGFNYEKYPVTYLDVYGKNGHPVRTTVSNIGSRLLGRMLNLTEAQEGVLAIVFKIAEDEKLELVDLKDLKKLLTYVGEKRKDYSLNYGNVTSQSIGAIQRNLLMLEQEGGEYFFGRPSFEIKDLIHYDNNDGRGYINILDAQELFKKPTLYASFLLWLLTEIYNTLPEVGDPKKPKLVFFFDEAHLLFSEMPDYLIRNIIQIVKLIRSKGVGLYFISQSPSDIPDEVLAQLGNRIQHVLRSYTKTDEKAIKAAADSFRENPEFDTEEAIKTLGTGEALVSFQDENGEPTIVEKVTILPPQSKMGTIDDLTRQNIIKQGFLYNKYETKIDEESAFEKISNKKEPITIKENKKKDSKLEKYADKLATKTINTIGRKLGNKIFKMFK
ncbi:MAG: DUF853 family protein [Bacilli bacterium]|nr:DUF853 family protein [Bacilli bacterium]